MADVSIPSMDQLYAQAQARILTQAVSRHFAPPVDQTAESAPEESAASPVDQGVYFTSSRPAANVAQMLYEQQQLLDLIARLPGAQIAESKPDAIPPR